MLDNFLVVLGQVVSLFLMIFVGFILSKAKLIKENAIITLSNVVLYVATPAAILQAFVTETPTAQKNINLLTVALFAVVFHILSIVIAKLLIKNKNDATRCVLRFSVIFSNCGFMAFPLQRAILGSIGVFYGAMFVAVYNIFVWTYGAVLVSGNKKFISVKSIITNPAIIATVISVVLYLFKAPLPSFLSGAVTQLGTLNTPLPMLIIGYYLYNANLKQVFCDKRIYFPALVRMVIIPLIFLIILHLFGIIGMPLIALMVAASASTATFATMFATKFGSDVQVSVNMIALTTLICLVTMPIFVMLAQTL